eukprot:82262-Rhodomonas_salina.2
MMPPVAPSSVTTRRSIDACDQNQQSHLVRADGAALFGAGGAASTTQPSPELATLGLQNNQEARQPDSS